MPEIGFEQGLPANLDAERMILGSLLAGYAHPADVAATITADDFSLEKHRRIYAAAMACDAAGTRPDQILVAQELMRTNKLESVDGLSYLVSLDEGLPRISNLDGYLNLVRDKSLLRRTIFAAQKLIDEAMVASDPTPEILARCSTVISDLEGRAHSDRRMKAPQQVIDAAGSIESFLSPPRTRGVPTPWNGLNSLLTGGGFSPGQLVIVAARPSVGKTALACQIADHSATSSGGTALFTLEMPDEDILRRMVCSRAQVNALSLTHRSPDKRERYDLQQALSALTESALWIDDTTGCTVPAMRSQLRKLAGRHPLKMVVVDYLQLVESTGRGDRKRNEEVSEVSRGLKKLAREFRVPVVALSQLSRDSEKTNREPNLTDLRDSGAIEQDADIVIFPHRKTEPRGYEEMIDIDLLLKKQRNGPLGRVEMYFVPKFTRFHERERDRSAA